MVFEHVFGTPVNALHRLVDGWSGGLNFMGTIFLNCPVVIIVTFILPMWDAIFQQLLCWRPSGTDHFGCQTSNSQVLMKLTPKSQVQRGCHDLPGCHQDVSCQHVSSKARVPPSTEKRGNQHETLMSDCIEVGTVHVLMCLDQHVNIFWTSFSILVASISTASQ